MILKGCCHDPDTIQPVAVQLRILEMHMVKAMAVVMDRLNRIHHLPDHMRRVVVESKVRRRYDLEHPVPDRRRCGEILAPRPFIHREVHGAVLDADADIVRFRKLYHRWPYPPESFHVLVHAF